MKSMFFAAIILGVLFVFFVGQDAFGKKQSTEQKITERKLVSSSSKAMSSAGQGEQMLNSAVQRSPQFIKSENPSKKLGSKLRLSGICRDDYGVMHTSDDKNYANCLGSSIQRQTGIGISLQE